MRLILVRHGETEGNVMKINEGQKEGILTDKGRLQAIALGKRLSEQKIDVIFVSDLKRCVQTAEHIIIHHPNTPIFYEPLLRERNLGILEGSKRGEVIRQAQKVGLDIIEHKPQGGESILDVKERVKTFFNMLKNEYSDKTILIISHGQFIANMILYALGLDDTHYESYKQKNTAVSMITFKDKPVLEVTNCILHLNNNFLSK